MTTNAIRYTIRDLPNECVALLREQRALTGRNIGLLVADALAHWIVAIDIDEGHTGAHTGQPRGKSDGDCQLEPSSVAQCDSDRQLRSGARRTS